MQSATEHSVSAIKAIDDDRSDPEISAIAASVEEKCAATHECALYVQQAAQGATQVTGSIADVNRGASDTGAAAEQVHVLAVSLLTESNHLSTEVENFLQTVRVA
jgi:methyl-accepting chemotaxis protein